MMRLRAAPCMVIVKREEKESKLKEFISGVLDQLLAGGTLSRAEITAGWCVIARSAESPVLKALAAIAAESGAINIRVLVALMDPPLEQLDVIGSSHRHLADPRHLNAHEQLILGPVSSWIGDCMRREPAKRDAYEQFAPDCALTAKWATTSFDRLWAAAEATPRREVAPVHELSPVEAAVAAAVGQTSDVPVTTTVSTRH
ncbi:MAG: hypothetical protein ACOYLQ_12435 [Hyphomicrobiaceae bacterium]